MPTARTAATSSTSSTSSNRSGAPLTPGDGVARRHIGIDPLPSDAWATAAFAGYPPEQDRSPEQQAAVQLAATLTDELAAADALLFASGVAA